MATTFQVGGTIITFRLLLAGAELARASATTVRHIPGGNISYLDHGGLELPTLKGQAQLVSFADLILLQSIQDASGTLTYSEAVYTATLRSCSRTKATGRGDVQFANVEFVLEL